MELGRIEDVATAVGVSGEAPDFQRFPILVKASEAEKNYVAPLPSLATASAVLAPASTTALPLSTLPPLQNEDGKPYEALKAYIGGLDPNVTEQHIFALFSQFGPLVRVQLQLDPSTKLNRGFAFVTYRDPKDANLAIQSMTNQMLARKMLRASWAKQSNANTPGVLSLTTTELPGDAQVKVQKAMIVLGQLNGSPPPPVPAVALASAAAAVTSSVSQATAAPVAAASTAVPAPEIMEGKKQEAAQIAAAIAETANAPPAASSIPTVAEARASMVAAIAKSNLVAATAAATAAAGFANAHLAHSGSPTRYLLVHNMYNKDEETDPGWQDEIKEDFVEESAKFGKIQQVTVMHTEPGGKIYASFETVEGARACAKNLHGRWFDKRQLRVDFVHESDLPPLAGAGAAAVAAPASS